MQSSGLPLLYTIKWSEVLSYRERNINTDNYQQFCLLAIDLSRAVKHQEGKEETYELLNIRPTCVPNQYDQFLSFYVFIYNKELKECRNRSLQIHWHDKNLFIWHQRTIFYLSFFPSKPTLNIFHSISLKCKLSSCRCSICKLKFSPSKLY